MVGLPLLESYPELAGRGFDDFPAEQGGNTPAIALAVYARSEDRLKVILASFQTHMAKLAEAAELLALVASLAGRVAGH